MSCLLPARRSHPSRSNRPATFRRLVSKRIGCRPFVRKYRRIMGKDVNVSGRIILHLVGTGLSRVSDPHPTRFAPWPMLRHIAARDVRNDGRKRAHASAFSSGG